MVIGIVDSAIYRKRRARFCTCCTQQAPAVLAVNGWHSLSAVGGHRVYLCPQCTADKGLPPPAVPTRKPSTEKPKRKGKKKDEGGC